MVKLGLYCGLNRERAAVLWICEMGIEGETGREDKQ